MCGGKEVGGIGWVWVWGGRGGGEGGKGTAYFMVCPRQSQEFTLIISAVAGERIATADDGCDADEASGKPVPTHRQVRYTCCLRKVKR